MRNGQAQSLPCSENHQAGRLRASEEPYNMTQRQVKKQIQDRQQGRTDRDLLWIMIYMSVAMVGITALALNTLGG